MAAAPSDSHAADFRLAPLKPTLERPLYLTAPPGDTERLFVVQQTGEIRIIRDGTLLGRPFLDIGDLVSEGSEQGLLGLAFHPQFATSGRFYVNYTNTAGNTRVAEYRVKDDRPNEADPGSTRHVIGYDQPFSNHNGGHLAFGPDGYLYIGSGDGGSGGDPKGHGQRLNTLLGKILRIDVDGRDAGLPYAIPPDNPFVSRAGARGEIFAYGLRNPWRFSFDRTRGDLWIGDVGQNAVEEIDFLAAGSSGANFGWNPFEGSQRFSDSPVNGTATPPVAEYSHDVGCSVTGGYVYRGEAISELRGQYLYADFCTGALFRQPAGPTPGAARRVTELNVQLSGVTSFGEDAAGELYVTQADGTIYRLAPVSAASRVTLSRGQLRINQRISQAAIRRVNALIARFEGRPAPDPGQPQSGTITLSRAQLLINQRISQAAVRRVNALTARVEGREPPEPGGPTGGTVTLSARQLLINQRISQAAVRRVNALDERIPVTSG